VNPVGTENLDEKHHKARESCIATLPAFADQHLSLSAKRTGTQRRTKVSP